MTAHPQRLSRAARQSEYPKSIIGPTPFSVAEIGALAHLYRGEIYRSTIWRTRLDTTTNWAVVVTGVSFTLTFGSVDATALPLILVGLLVSVFLLLEARRYRYFNVWRARARLLETDFYAPMLRGIPYSCREKWPSILAKDYDHPQFHISYARAVGRRLRKNYVWVLGIQIIAYCGKLIIHPIPATNFSQILDRAGIGPIPGAVLLAAGGLFYGFWAGFALWTYLIEHEARRDKRTLITIA